MNILIKQQRHKHHPAPWVLWGFLLSVYPSFLQLPRNQRRHIIWWSNARTHAAFSTFSVCICHPEATATEVWLQKWTWLRNCSWKYYLTVWLYDIWKKWDDISWISLKFFECDCAQMMGVHTSGEPRWLSLFWGWLQTFAIHFTNHLPLEFCFSFSPSAILQKSKITSCGEPSCKNHEQQKPCLPWNSRQPGLKIRAKKKCMEIQSPSTYIHII